MCMCEIVCIMYHSRIWKQECSSVGVASTAVMPFGAVLCVFLIPTLGRHASRQRCAPCKLVFSEDLERYISVTSWDLLHSSLRFLAFYGVASALLSLSETDPSQVAKAL